VKLHQRHPLPRPTSIKVTPSRAALRHKILGFQPHAQYRITVLRIRRKNLLAKDADLGILWQGYWSMLYADKQTPFCGEGLRGVFNFSLA